VFLQSILGWRTYVVFFLTMLAAISESFGILMLLPLFEGLKGADALTEPGGFLQDILAFFGIGHSTLGLLVFISAAFIIKGVITFSAYSYAAYLKAVLLRELKTRLFNGYCQMDRIYYDLKDTGHFINVVNEQATRSILTFQFLIHFGSQVVNVLIYLGIAFIVAWRFGVMALVVGVLVILFFKQINVYVRTLSRRSAEENGRLAKRLIQSLTAFKYLNATGQMKKPRNEVQSAISNLTGYEVRRGLASSLTQTVREPASVAIIIAIVAFQIGYLEQSIEPILVAIVLFYRAMNSALIMQARLQGSLEYVGSLEMVRKELEDQKTYQEPDGSTDIGRLHRDIRVENVSFKYGDTSNEVLKDVSLDIPAFSSVALVGESGSGKSTLIDLITLSLRPLEGQILLDGVPGHEVRRKSWREQIGFVIQDTILFDDTIANNICMWQSNPKTDDALMARIKDAARQADMADFIETLPEGYHSVVGDRGARLSGGQRQRLFIAREIFRQPNVLILDEATSALDSSSERNVYASIEKLKGKVTLIVISHRLSTIRDVDRIFVLDKGRIIEDGTYDELHANPASKLRLFASLQAM
jgi:subfamily B ATP-binding cassette protein MsbA